MQNLEQILNLAETEAQAMGLAVLDLRFSQQGRRRTLEITIFRKGGRVSLNDCEELSRKLDKLFDAQEPPLVEGAYLLEVQSPGLDRVLKSEREFRLLRGELVEVKSKDQIEHLGFSFKGRLGSCFQGVLEITNPEPMLNESKKQKKKLKVPEPQIALPESLSLDLTRVSHVRLYLSELVPEG